MLLAKMPETTMKKCKKLDRGNERNAITKRGSPAYLFLLRHTLGLMQRLETPTDQVEGVGATLSCCKTVDRPCNNRSAVALEREMRK